MLPSGILVGEFSVGAYARRGLPDKKTEEKEAAK